MPIPDTGLERNFYTSSSCGVCGKASIDAIRTKTRYDVAGDDLRLPLEVLLALPDRLRAAQQVFDKTGGLHAAGLFTAAGELVALREDVGRHNAVDKVIGDGVRAGRLPLAGHVLMVSGRASFELTQKAAMAGIPVLAAVSAPSSLAVELAREVGITLVGFLRGDGCNVYTRQTRADRPPARGEDSRLRARGQSSEARRELGASHALAAAAELADDVGEQRAEHGERVADAAGRAGQVDDQRAARRSRPARGRAPTSARRSPRRTGGRPRRCPGASRSSTARVASGVTSVGESPVPPVVRMTSKSMSTAERSTASSSPTSSGRTCGPSTVKPSSRRPSASSLAAGVLVDAGGGPVGRGEDERPGAGGQVGVIGSTPRSCRRTWRAAGRR